MFPGCGFSSAEAVKQECAIAETVKHVVVNQKTSRASASLAYEQAVKQSLLSDRVDGHGR